MKTKWTQSIIPGIAETLRFLIPVELGENKILESQSA